MAMPEDNCVYDARSLFGRHRSVKYQVSIEVTPTFAFFLTVVKCMFFKKLCESCIHSVNTPFWRTIRLRTNRCLLSRCW
jgi:hypothetical protein